MIDAFIKILNMSISASWVVLVVLLLRLLLKRAPKWVFVLLWAIVGIRMLCPFSIESAFSMIPSVQTIDPDIMLDITPTVETGVSVIDHAVNPVIAGSNTPAIGASANPLQISFALMAVIWLTGMAVMLLYAVVSYVNLRRKVAEAFKVETNIYQSERIAFPFVLGVFRPRIYLPFQISEQNATFVIAHEQSHIHRKDHLWKPIGFLLLAIHWFNPLLWLAYVLLCRDIELACDERVIKELETEERANYSAALLSCSASHRMVTACPLAFGEVSVKTRIKAILCYKKPGFWIILTAIVICCVVAACFLTDPVGDTTELDLSFLNYENATSQVADRAEIDVIYYPPVSDETESFIKLGYVHGNDLAQYLDNCKWRDVNGPKETLSSPGSVQFVIEDEYRITIYERKEFAIRQYARVDYLGDVRYYTTHSADYADAVDMFHTLGDRGDERTDITSDGQYYHVISAEGVAELKLTGRNFSGGCVNADGSPFKYGEKVWLEPLEGHTNLEDITLTALDKTGKSLYSCVLIPYEVQNGEDGTVVITNTDPKWNDGVTFTNLGPNEEKVSNIEISLLNDMNIVQYSITWTRTGLTLEYGLRASDGTEYWCGNAGGSGNGQFEKIPAGTYRLFVRNTDYTGVPAYENPALFPDVSFEATGVMNFRVE